METGAYFSESPSQHPNHTKTADVRLLVVSESKGSENDNQKREKKWCYGF